MAKSRKEIYGRIDKLVLDALSFVNEIPRTLVNIVLARQFIRSVTSIGANASEAEGAPTKKDFIYCFAISKKEAKESSYWLMLMAAQNPKLTSRANKVKSEVDELIAIISSIIISAKRNKI